MDGYDELLVDAIPELLRRIPERWEDFDVHELTDIEQKALYLLIAAGMVERRWSIRVTLIGHPAAFEATLTATGEYGAVEAGDLLTVELWKHWSGWVEDRRDPPQLTVEHVPPELWRLTADGQLALRDIDGDGRYMAVDFVLRRGLYDGRPVLQHGQIKQRIPVRGNGMLIRVCQSEASPQATSGITIENWQEGAEAFAAVIKAAAVKSECIPDPPNPIPAADGPFGINCFRWRGTVHRGLAPRAQKLLECVWPAPDRTCTYDAAIEALYVDDHPDALPADPLGGARKDANTFFRKAGIPLAVRVSGDRRMGRVSLVEAQPSKPKRNRKKPK